MTTNPTLFVERPPESAWLPGIGDWIEYMAPGGNKRFGQVVERSVCKGYIVLSSDKCEHFEVPAFLVAVPFGYWAWVLAHQIVGRYDVEELCRLLKLDVPDMLAEHKGRRYE